MKVLHILKSEPDENTNALIDLLSKGEEASTFSLYDDEVDYERLIDAIFDHEKVISWW